MAKEKYITSSGFSIEVAEAFTYNSTGLSCLVIQSNEDRDIHLSEIKTCDDFTQGGPELVFEFRGWIYSMLQTDDKHIYAANTGKTLRYGPHGSPEIVLNVDADITKLCASARGVWIVGLRGYVAHFDGTTLSEYPIPGGAHVYLVSEAPDGSVFACGDGGGLYQLSSGQWNRIELSTGADIFRIIAQAADRVWMVGSNGLCARFEGAELRVFSPPDDRNYRAIAEYKGRMFVGAGHLGLDVIDGENVVGFKENVYSYYLYSNNDYLVSTGFNQICRFDGNQWLGTEFK